MIFLIDDTYFLFSLFFVCSKSGTLLRRFVQPCAACRLRHVSLGDILTYQITGNKMKRPFLSESLPGVPGEGPVRFSVDSPEKTSEWSRKTG